MKDLVQWLGAQLDADERIARAATPGPWAQSGIGEYGWGVSFGRNGAGVEADDSDQGRADAEHIAEHNPARVLREIEAKRQIIEQHKRYAAERRRMMGGWDPQSDDSPILAALASVYADRPGYLEEWRP